MYIVHIQPPAKDRKAKNVARQQLWFAHCAALCRTVVRSPHSLRTISIEYINQLMGHLKLTHRMHKDWQKRMRA